MIEPDVPSAGTPRRVLRYALPAFVGLVVAALAVGWFLLPDAHTRPIGSLEHVEVPELFPPAVVATTAVGDLEVFTEPDEASEPVTTLSAVTEYGLDRTLLVLDEVDGWIHALLPIRPNGATGWVRADDVTLSTTTYRIEVSLGERTVTLYDGGTEILHESAAIGTDATPTPPGQYYVTDPLDLRDQPGTGYGAYALGISGYSEVLLSFAGGPGQLALHGTTNPADLGQAVSNGCVRLTDDVILAIAELVPLGTPVTIAA